MQELAVAAAVATAAAKPLSERQVETKGLSQTNQSDIEIWCSEHLPDVYDPGMFDDEDTHDDILETISGLIQETVTDLMDDVSPEEREALHEEMMESAVGWLDAHHAAQIEAIEPEPPIELILQPQVAQHSADWYAQRRNRLTASEFAQILDGRRGALLRSKVAPVAEGASADRPFTAPIAIAQPDGEMNATSWGHRFERVVRRIYEIEQAGPGTVNDSLGRFTHQEIPWLSASPDGVVAEGLLAGRLLEIKAPKTRVPGLFVPFEYYVQMQIQMEVCDMPAVDFVEAQFAQRPDISLSGADRDAIAAARYKGRIRVCGITELPDTWVIQYSDPVEDLEDAAQSLPPPVENLPVLEESTWWLVGWSPRTVLRNTEWWHNKGWPEAQLFWAEVESLRQEYDTTSTKEQEGIVYEGVGWQGSTY
jgi:hypothetical protein